MIFEGRHRKNKSKTIHITTKNGFLFALCAMVHTTTQYTPALLVFGQDSILNTHQEANCQLIMKQKQDLINKGNQQENHNQKEHTYNKGDKVLLKNAWKTKFNQNAYALC